MWSIMTPKCILGYVHSLHLKIIKNRKGVPLTPICKFSFSTLNWPLRFLETQFLKCWIDFMQNGVLKYLCWWVFTKFEKLQKCFFFLTIFDLYSESLRKQSNSFADQTFFESLYEPSRQWLGWQFTGGHKSITWQHWKRFLRILLQFVLA